MYNLTEAQMEVLQTGLLRTRITILNDQTAPVITGSDIVQGGLSIDRYCTSDDVIGLGTAIASEMTLKLLNYDGRFNGVSFTGKELKVEVGKDDLWIPCGVYRVDDPPRMLSQINISALDRMTLLDIPADASSWPFPMSLQTLVERGCLECGVVLADDISGYINADLQVLYVAATASTTWRTVIQHAALLMGTCAYMDRNGDLAFGWYADTDYRITPSNRLIAAGCDINENSITIGGIEYTDLTETYTFGDGYTLKCGGSSIAFNANIDSVMAPVLAKIRGLTYRPFTAGVKAAWYMDPLDKVTWVSADDDEIPTLITHINTKMNGSTMMKAVGDEAARSIYNTSGMTREIENAISNADVQVGGVNLVVLSNIRIVGTVAVNDGVLAANGKDVEIKTGGI